MFRLRINFPLKNKLLYRDKHLFVTEKVLSYYIAKRLAFTLT